jgi:hypothetical protein
MLDLPENGLYRTTQPMPGHETAIPAGAIVYLGEKQNGGGKFVVRPAQNRNNRWYWDEPVTQLRSPSWAKTLRRLPSEGFYTLPDTIELPNGGRWLKNALVQLGFNEKGQGIIFVGERHESSTENVLRFSDRGMIIEDETMERLTWAPILPVRDDG